MSLKQYKKVLRKSNKTDQKGNSISPLKTPDRSYRGYMHSNFSVSQNNADKYLKNLIEQSSENDEKGMEKYKMLFQSKSSKELSQFLENK